MCAMHINKGTNEKSGQTIFDERGRICRAVLGVCIIRIPTAVGDERLSFLGEIVEA